MPHAIRYRPTAWPASASGTSFGEELHERPEREPERAEGRERDGAERVAGAELPHAGEQLGEAAVGEAPGRTRPARRRRTTRPGVEHAQHERRQRERREAERAGVGDRGRDERHGLPARPRVGAPALVAERCGGRIRMRLPSRTPPGKRWARVSRPNWWASLVIPATSVSHPATGPDADPAFAADAARLRTACGAGMPSPAAAQCVTARSAPMPGLRAHGQLVERALGAPRSRLSTVPSQQPRKPERDRDDRPGCASGRRRARRESGPGHTPGLMITSADRRRRRRRARRPPRRSVLKRRQVSASSERREVRARRDGEREADHERDVQPRRRR